jgi:ATP-binding cassette subfamily B (MDR/TAP) protein 1
MENRQPEIIDLAEPKRLFAIVSWRYIWPEIIFIFLGLIGAAGAAIIPCMIVFVFGEVINGISGHSPVSGSAIVKLAQTLYDNSRATYSMNQFSLNLSQMAFAAFIFHGLWHTMLTIAHGRIGATLKQTYFSALLDQEIGYFDMKRTGALLNDLSESMELIQDAYSFKIGEFANLLAQMIFAFIMALVKGWKIALVMMGVLPLFVVLLGFTGTTVGFVQSRINRINGSAASISNEIVSAIRTVRSMDGEESEKKKFNKELSKNTWWICLKGIFHGVSIGVCMFISWGCVALGFWYGAQLLLTGEITFGALFQIMIFNLMGFLCASSILTLLGGVGKSDRAMISLLKVIRRTPRMRPSGGMSLGKLDGLIEFKNVSFSYPTRPDVKVLQDFSLVILPGQSVALVGASGSGKSTIVGLLEKFYEVDSGDIMLDGTNLSEIDPRWLHSNIGIVTQEPTLFATTIRENILYAVKQSGRTVTEEDIINAAKSANAHDFITQLPNGYDTVLGERGVSMSGGQKQRIAIARAMIQDPKVLLLDEATSALDTQSEAVVQEALDKLMEGRTCIIIAHRLSTIIDCNVICVMQKGELKEKGTHEELMKIENGHYFNLAARQMMISSGNESKSGIDDNPLDQDGHFAIDINSVIQCK